MALTQVTGPYPIFTDLDGTPLDDGYLYIGAINEDPETNPIQVFWDSNLTIPASQPIRTNSGYAYRNGTPALIYTAGQFSITIRNKREEFVLYSPVGYGFDPGAVSASVVKNDFTGDGVEVNFALSAAPSTILATNVFINGVYQEKDSYSLLGNTITFSIAPPLNSSIEVMTNETGIINTGNATAITYTAGFSGATLQTVQTKLEQYVSVKDFGAVGDGVADDSAAINAGASALQALGGGTLGFPRGDYYIASNTVTIPKYVEVKADADAILIQDAAATGTAMVIQGRPFSETIRRSRIHVLPSIQKGAAAGQPLWNTGADTSSIGLHIYGCSDDTFFLRAVAYFYNGVLMNSDYPAPAPNNTLCVNNTVNLGNIRNCYKGLWLEDAANSNTFIQGTINVDSAWITAGTTHITLKGSESNTNTFVGTNLEGVTAGLKAVEVESIANLFNNCRTEGLPAGALRFTFGANGNIWIGGSDKPSSVSQGYFDAVVSDSGFGNTFQWAGTYSGRHVTIDNGAGTDRQGIGFSVGTFPTAWVSAFAANRLWLKGTVATPLAGVRYQGCMNQETLTITSGTNWLNRNANIIVADYASPQSITVFGNVGALSDVTALATIMDLNGNITLVHTSSPASGAGRFVLTGGVNLLLTANRPVQFMSHDGNWYQV
jgi:hypothetical protein